ncbi:hypothetical protein H7J86_24305 [Mycobacterium hackensackense]|uniref:hypothetical protein n=1 Tax=Mycobacterium hackensackense TaxID=228909 RepID=UPI002265F16D|nr:hypothetical protein [Mycobacterium hackensackense]MCV7255290.1 hypothetical protein [Mycobacterium hackensackense]
MTFRGKQDVCRHCGHPRAGHRDQVVGLSRICAGSAACGCLGFAPAHLTWDVFETPQGWTVQHRETGRVFPGLPGPAAAEQLARTLTDLEDMFTRINEGGVSCAL